MNKLLKQMMKAALKPLELIENQYVAGGLKLFLVLYAGMIAPKLPNFIAKLFKNAIVKMVVLFLIIYTGIKDPMMSLMIAVGFTLTMVSLNRLETAKDVHDLLDAVVDVPQELLNEIIDGAQGLANEASEFADDKVLDHLKLGYANEANKYADKAIDFAQDLGNKVVDGAQELVSKAVGMALPKKAEQKAEEFSLEDPASKFDMEKMGQLGELSGWMADSQNEASVEQKQEEQKQEEPKEEEPKQEE
tara:strand:- start:548 stop:1288 length:741 start_codon:yes stop_codon:yes gene_type:complete